MLGEVNEEDMKVHSAVIMICYQLYRMHLSFNV